jgi:formylglycine-generating enzyme required for sulfatase activity
MARHPHRSIRLALAAALVVLAVPSAVGLEIDPAEMELVRQIHARIVAQQEREPSELQRYEGSLPGSGVTYAMVPVGGGQFLMGSPAREKGRRPDEGPQRRVEVSSFWMGAVPVTWDQFELFMYRERLEAANAEVDAVSRPTPPYVDMSFGMGKEGYPAISMTHHAASKFCQWLSAQTGRFYRLPTEAEWEYAARAGSSSAWFFGDRPDRLGEFAWYEENSDFKTQPVGRKRPNPWGLSDMSGNVWEWTLDAYSPDGYGRPGSQPLVNPWAKPQGEYPRVVRGGSWNDPPEDLRSAARKPSAQAWKMMDPQMPQSVWYHTNALWLGFRLVRPQTIPTPEEMYEYWNR